MPDHKRNSKKYRVVTSEVGNYEKHPYFVRKNAEAAGFLMRSGLPAGIVDKGITGKAATSPRSQHVIPHHDGWAIRGLGNEKVTKVTTTQKEAIETAREIARNHKSEVIIHGRDGRIRDRNSYVRGSDKSFSRKDKKH